MAKETKSTILIATISAISAIVIAVITTYGTIAVSEPEARKVKKELAEISDLKLIANLPIGTIVASMLEPTKFAKEVGDLDRETIEWVLADGQPIAATSRYGQLSGETKTPDLRGVFLRGMNLNGGQDPNNSREAGDCQQDALQQHGHDPNWTGLDDNHRVYEFGYTRDRNAKNAPEVSVTTVTGAKVDTETRPKNVAVYFYIKIN